MIWHSHGRVIWHPYGWVSYHPIQHGWVNWQGNSTNKLSQKLSQKLSLNWHINYEIPWLGDMTPIWPCITKTMEYHPAMCLQQLHDMTPIWQGDMWVSCGIPKLWNTKTLYYQQGWCHITQPCGCHITQPCGCHIQSIPATTSDTKTMEYQNFVLP